MSLRLGIAQIHTQAGDLAGTIERISVQAEMAAARGVDLLLFPLTTLTGLSPVPVVFQEEFMLAASEALDAIASRLACPCLIPLMLELNGVSVCDAILISDGSAKLVRESAHPIDANAPIALSFAQTSICLAFSYDEYERFLFGHPAVDVLVFFSDRKFSLDDPAGSLALADESPLMRPDASGIWTVAVGPVGAYDDSVFVGASYVAAPDGGMVAAGPPFDEAMVVADVGTGADVAMRAQRTPYDAYHYLWQALVTGIHDYVASLSITDVVLVLDGTLNCELLAVAATDALGPTHVHALACSLDAAQNDKRLAENLRLNVHVELGGQKQANGFDSAASVQLAAALFADEHNALILLPFDKTGIALSSYKELIPMDSFAPFADVLRSDLIASAHVRNAISPIFPSLTLSSRDLPTIEGISSSIETEVLLAQVDDVIAAYTAGDLSLAGHVDDLLRSWVLKALHSHTVRSLVALPSLTMSSVSLNELRFPIGFCWSPNSQPLNTASQSALPSMASISSSSVASEQSGEGEIAEPPDAYSVQKALQETLELIRDLSVGNVGGWDMPFSEN